MEAEKYRKFKRIMIPTVAVLLVAVSFLAVLTFKKERDRRNDERIAAESKALAEKIVTVTVPEGFTVTQISDLLEENGVCASEDFLNAVRNPTDSILDEFGIKKENKIFALEGYMFPDTYEFYKGEDAQEAVNIFLNNFREKVTDEYYVRAQQMGYSMDEIISVASIIQKEAGIDSEDSKVSSVIFNRLNSEMKLQCDVTGNYLEKYVKPYVDKYDEKYDALYDTFVCEGIPAGAICNPGMSCINAALAPDDTDYLFFVTDSVETSKFYYAETYEEHLVNCRQAGYSGY